MVPGSMIHRHKEKSTFYTSHVPFQLPHAGADHRVPDDRREPAGGADHQRRARQQGAER